mgnify:CR=1 FL=1
MNLGKMGNYTRYEVTTRLMIDPMILKSPGITDRDVSRNTNTLS